MGCSEEEPTSLLSYLHYHYYRDRLSKWTCGGLSRPGFRFLLIPVSSKRRTADLGLSRPKIAYIVESMRFLVRKRTKTPKGEFLFGRRDQFKRY